MKDALSYGIMVGAGETYFSAYGIFLGGTNVQIALLASLPPFLGALCQLLGLKLQRLLSSRRNAILLGSTAQAWCLLPIALLGLLASPLFDSRSPIIAGPTAASLLIACAALYYGALGVTAPVWSSLIGDLVPADRRGRFFARRNQLLGFSTCLAVLIGGITLEIFDTLHRTAVGFAAVFLFAMVARFRSAHWVTQYDDPTYVTTPADYFSFLQFIRRVRHSNFARFVLFYGLLNGAAAFSAPFFTIYMLRGLELSYVEYTVVTAAQALAGIAALRHWGRIVDRVGSKRVMSVCSFAVAVVPVLWLFGAPVWYLVLIQLFGGAAWAGFNLAAATFLFDAVTAQKRARCSAYQAVVNGVCVLGGSIIGGFTADRVTADFVVAGVEMHLVSPYMVIFLLSGLARLAIASGFYRRFHEVRALDGRERVELLYGSRRRQSGVARTAAERAESREDAERRTRRMLARVGAARRARRSLDRGEMPLAAEIALSPESGAVPPFNDATKAPVQSPLS